MVLYLKNGKLSTTELSMVRRILFRITQVLLLGRIRGRMHGDHFA